MHIKHNGGFTLMEIMIVVAIIGILAGIAYPNYMDHVLKSRRTDAKTALLSLQQAQEKLRGNCNVYAQTIGTGNNCVRGNAATTRVNGSSTSPEGWYNLTITGASNTGYTLIASVVSTGKQTGDTKCKSLVIEVGANAPDGAKKSYDAVDAGGTETTSTGGCW